MIEARKRYIIEFPDIPTERQSVRELPVEERISNFNKVSLGFTEDEAVREARRCLSCRRCLGCALCLAECDKEAIVFEEADEELEISVDSIIITPGAERVYSLPPEKFGYGRYMNVVTDVEFERIVSDNGAYGGLLIRPFDGEMPKSMGFMCWDHDDGERGASGLESLSYVVHEAWLAKKKIEELEITLFLPNKEEYVEELEKSDIKVPGLGIRKGEVIAITEAEENKNLIVKWSENGDVKEEEFEMIVLSTDPQLPGYVTDLAKKLNIELDDMKKGSLLSETSKKGVFLAGSTGYEKIG
ncbi:MAG: hypothetical protein ABID54_14575 [Pseudomonadota bacterium]